MQGERRRHMPGFGVKEGFAGAGCMRCRRHMHAFKVTQVCWCRVYALQEAHAWCRGSGKVMLPQVECAARGTCMVWGQESVLVQNDCDCAARGTCLVLGLRKVSLEQGFSLQEVHAWPGVKRVWRFFWCRVKMMQEAHAWFQG